MNRKTHNQRRRTIRNRMAYGVPIEMEESRNYRMCYKKRTYTTETQAIRAAIGSSQVFGPCRVYKCPVCGHYHLTTQVVVYNATWAEEHPDEVYVSEPENVECEVAEPEAIECEVSVAEETIETKDDDLSYYFIEFDEAVSQAKLSEIALSSPTEYDTSIFTVDYPKAG